MCFGGLCSGGLVVGVQRFGGSGARDQRAKQERGASLPLLALVLVIVLMTTSLVIGLTVRVMDRAQAQAAADAAALAGVMEGRAGAERFAAANGGAVVLFEATDNAVHVVVVVDGWRAEARAERSVALPE